MGAVADLFARLTLRPDKKSFDAADKMLSAVKTALVGIVAFKTAGFLAGMVGEVAKTGARLADLSEQTGIGTESLQELGYAAQLSATDMESLVAGLKKAGMGLEDAATKGEGPMADALREIGISTADVKSKLSGPGGFDDILGMVADKFATMEPGVKKSNLAMAIFGKTGAELIPLLNRGSAGLDELRAAAHEAGFVMDDEAVEALAGLDDQLDETHLNMQGLKQEIVIGLLPTVKSLIADFLAWVKANRKMISQKLAAVLKGIAAALRVVAKAVGIVIDVFVFLSNHIEAVIVALGALGLALAIYQAKAIWAGLKSAAAWALSVAPLVLLAAIIAAVILIVEDLYTFFDGGDSVFGRFYASIKNWIGEKVMGVINFFIRGINTVIGALETLSNKAAEFMEDHDWLMSLTGGAGAAGAALAKQTREAARAAGQDPNADFGRIDELKMGDWNDETLTPEDKAYANYDSPEAKAQREKNFAASRAAAGRLVPASVPVGRGGGSTVTTAKVEINVNGTPGDKDIAKIKDTISDWWEDQRRQAAAGVKR